jgi:ABC-type sugar transport system ATPase subunit
MTESSATTVPPVLTLQNVRKTYRGREALKGISLELRPGELLGFFGPNGAGKTTMIRCISGLLKPDSGTIIVTHLILETMMIPTTTNPFDWASCLRISRSIPT